MDVLSVKAGLLYCVVVFAAGFVLGAMRTVAVAPLAGSLVAVTLEAPVMLAISWHACGWAAERLDVTPRLLDRLLMGGIAFAVVIGAEAMTGLLANGRSIPDYFRHHGESALLLGLMAQLGFAVFPTLQRWRS
jgi:hypothetical protein